MKSFIDIAGSVSGRLSKILEIAVNDMNADGAPTLASVREFISRTADGEQFKADSMRSDQSCSVLEEIDNLIEQFGANAPAIDFITIKAGESLTRLISELMDTCARTPPTLGMVRDAILHGLVARLVGDGSSGALDADKILREEIRTLISRYGQDPVVEHFLRNEREPLAD